MEAVKSGNKSVIEDVKRLAKYTETLPETPQELCNQVFHTVYMGMSKQSSKETRQRAKVCYRRFLREFAHLEFVNNIAIVSRCPQAQNLRSQF